MGISESTIIPGSTRRDFLKQTFATLLTPSLQVGPTTREGIIQYVQENIGKSLLPELISDLCYDQQDRDSCDNPDTLSDLLLQESRIDLVIPSLSFEDLAPRVDTFLKNFNPQHCVDPQNVGKYCMLHIMDILGEEGLIPQKKIYGVLLDKRRQLLSILSTLPDEVQNAIRSHPFWDDKKDPFSDFLKQLFVEILGNKPDAGEELIQKELKKIRPILGTIFQHNQLFGRVIHYHDYYILQERLSKEREKLGSRIEKYSGGKWKLSDFEKVPGVIFQICKLFGIKNL